MPSRVHVSRCPDRLQGCTEDCRGSSASFQQAGGQQCDPIPVPKRRDTPLSHRQKHLYACIRMHGRASIPAPSKYGYVIACFYISDAKALNASNIDALMANYYPQAVRQHHSSWQPHAARRLKNSHHVSVLDQAGGGSVSRWLPLTSYIRMPFVVS